MKLKLKQMYEEGKVPLTKADLIKGFRKLGIKEKDKIMVHSSLSSFGYIVGAERDVIESLQEVVTNQGVILMPGHSGWNTHPSTWSNPPMPFDWQEHISKNIRAFDPKKTPIDFMGRIPVSFSNYPDVFRTYHPTLSFLLWGDIEDYKYQPLDDPLGKDSALMKLYQEGGKVLMLGVSYENITALHLAEYLSDNIPFEINKSKILEAGEEVWVSYREKVAQCEYYNKIGEMYEKSSEYTELKLGYADCKLVDVKDLVNSALYFFKYSEKINS